MKIKTFSDNNMGQNIFLYFDEQSGEGILIDAGCSSADKKAITVAISQNNIIVKAILLTHGHYDHIIAADEMKNLTGASVYCHESEQQVLENPNLNLSVHMGKNIALTADGIFNDRDVFRFGNCALKVLHTPGHTTGGVCYFDEENGILFSGDTLFMGSIGRTDFPQGNHASLLDNIKTKLLSLPENTKVYPGHGQSTTIGAEKMSNPFFTYSHPAHTSG